jgi:hypothetical protein
MSRTYEEQLQLLTESFKIVSEALDESIKLQSHYATLLNSYDGGKRLTFANSTAWIKRLKKIACISSQDGK